jgi:hypothetical protein
MQPPRPRTPRFDLGNTETLRALIVNVTAGLTTLMLLRFATLLVGDAGGATVPGYIRMFSDPIVWPFRQIPLLDIDLIQDVRIADVVTIPLIALVGLLITGILTGWRESDTGARRYPAWTDQG